MERYGKEMKGRKEERYKGERGERWRGVETGGVER